MIISLQFSLNAAISAIIYYILEIHIFCKDNNARNIYCNKSMVISSQKACSFGHILFRYIFQYMFAI